MILDEMPSQIYEPKTPLPQEKRTRQFDLPEYYPCYFTQTFAVHFNLRAVVIIRLEVANILPKSKSKKYTLGHTYSGCLLTHPRRWDPSLWRVPPPTQYFTIFVFENVTRWEHTMRGS